MPANTSPNSIVLNFSSLLIITTALGLVLAFPNYYGIDVDMGEQIGAAYATIE